MYVVLYVPTYKCDVIFLETDVGHIIDWDRSKYIELAVLEPEASNQLLRGPSVQIRMKQRDAASGTRLPSPRTIRVGGPRTRSILMPIGRGCCSKTTSRI